MAITNLMRRQVQQRADFLCEYCHSSEEMSPSEFEVDHIQPRSKGGSDDLTNLALACQRCNSHHYNFEHGRDPSSGMTVALFHPRLQNWQDHFMWNRSGTQIIGTTEIGRATVIRLDVNDEVKGDGKIMRTRSLWVSVGWHPPIGDRQQ